MNFKKITIHTIFIFLLCSLVHFGYDVFPNVITSIFFPVNESIWEHLKMIFTSCVIFSLLLRLKNKDSTFLIKTYLRFILTTIILLLIYLPIYYLFGEILVVTLIILFISIFISEMIILNYHPKKHQKMLNLAGLILLVFTLFFFIIFTYYPLKVDLFYDHSHKKYGIDILNE